MMRVAAMLVVAMQKVVDDANGAPPVGHLAQAR
jgi:hypothetical protein